MRQCWMTSHCYLVELKSRNKRPVMRDTLPAGLFSMLQTPMLKDLAYLYPYNLRPGHFLQQRTCYDHISDPSSFLNSHSKSTLSFLGLLSLHQIQQAISSISFDNTASESFMLLVPLLSLELLNCGEILVAFGTAWWAGQLHRCVRQLLCRLGFRCWILIILTVC